jgi:hypothetical protein
MFVARWIPVACILAGGAYAQTAALLPAQHLNFDRPESWALKYFTSTTLLSGLPVPESTEAHHVGSITVGVELGWMPELNAERARVGFSGHKEEDLNKTPLFARPVVRIGLPWKLTLIAAGPPPLLVFGVRPHLFDLGLERPIVERARWTVGMRIYGQVGSVTGAFTCPKQVLGFPAGSPNNPSGCIAQSADEAAMRYVGSELQVSHPMPGMPKLTPHASAGVNFMDDQFNVNAPLETLYDRTRLWTHGFSLSGTAGATYMLTNRVGFTVDAFYTPLLVRRDLTGPRTNDGLFNVRAMLSYSFR